MSLPTRARRARATALLLAAGLLSPLAAAADLAPLPEPEADWAKFLAQGDASTSYELYKLIDVVEGEDVDVDLEPCKQNAEALDTALRKMPVGLSLWYSAYRCADLRGEADAAEHYLAGFTRLARHALAQANDDVAAPPIRVFAYPDIRILMQATGMQWRYSLIDADRPRYLEIVEAIEDKDAGRERLLRFDYLDTLVQLERADPQARYPSYRKQLADGLVQGLARGGTRGGKDLVAVRKAVDADTDAERLALLREAATAGGVQATWQWIHHCYTHPSPTCADGLVDALLPAAESRHAYALVLLGLAHAEGIGVARDEKYAMGLLDAADAQLGDGKGTVMYARYQLGLHDDKMPDGLRQRLQRAADAGHPLAARLIALQRYTDIPGYVATDADLAPLIALASKGQSQVAGTIGSMLFSADRFSDAAPWVIRGAAAGDPESQRRYAWLLEEGYGVERDPAAAVRWLEAAAAGGNTQAMQQLALRAGGLGDWAAAEQWLLGGMRYNDLDSALQLATYYGEGHPGLSKKPAEGVALLERLDAAMDRVEIRQVLADMYAKGKGVPADTAKARALLAKDAEAGDRRSQLLLAYGLSRGELGAKEPVEAERWFKRAATDGNLDALDAYAMWLFNQSDTTQARARGLAMWRGVPADAKDANRVWNNLAWALCTGRDASLRAPAEGLAVLARTGELATLPLSIRDTAAACLAAAGRYDEAAAQQRLVVEHVQSENAADPSLPQMRARLALYAAGKAYVEDSPP
jgi:TPR repeat protein